MPTQKPFQIKRGDIVTVNLEPVLGHEQKGTNRPCVVIQNDMGNQYSPNTIVAIITDKDKSGKFYPVFVSVNKSDGNLNKDSIIDLSSIRQIDKRRINNYIGTFDSNIMTQVDTAIKNSLQLE